MDKVLKTILFYKKENNWYADIEGHTETENIMVGEACDILNALSKEVCTSDNPCLLLSVINSYEPSSYLASKRRSHNGYGATYNVINCRNNDFKEFWLCNVVHSVFRDHPKELSIVAISSCSNTKYHDIY